MLIPKLSPRQWRLAVFAIFAIVGIALWVLFRFISPAPPSKITITAGATDGAYYQFAKRYQSFLKENGITLDIVASSGSVENLATLKGGRADVGFVQSGLGFLTTDPDKDTSESSLLALATVAYEPVWIFSHTSLDASLKPLTGKRIAIGAEGSGTRKVALELLKDYGIDATNATLVAEGGTRAAGELIAKNIDAAILIGAPESPAVTQLLRANDESGIKLAALEHADGLARRFPYLQTITLKRGAVDPKRNLPGSDVLLLATSANLVVPDSLHPALAFLLLEAARHSHHTPSLFNNAEEFPRAKGVDFPLSEEAERYFKDGRPFLQRYLPFWLANFVQRMILILVPLLAIAVPIFKTIPDLLDIKDKSRLYYRYDELLKIEAALRTRHLAPDEVAAARKKLDEIDANIRTTKFPLDFSDRVLTLRQHIDFVRQKLDSSAS
jgi:TRAP transporter TAXI family solute receptor